jgi:DNA polymerase alpha subunit B
VEGANPSGFCLVARRLVSGLPGPRAPDASADSAAPFSLVVAAGPFTCAGDLAYEPLTELLSYCTEKRPDVLLLVGPFVDTEHPLVAGGTLDESFDTLFDTRVRDALLTYCDAAGGACRVALLPSTRDAAAQPVFPQPPLDSRLFDDTPVPAQIICAPNPAVLRVGGLDVAASAADILKALSGAEAARGGAANEDRLARLASHVIGQRSFFPLFPPPLGAMLDAKRAQVGLLMPHAPHLLLLPSDLAPFAKLLPGGPSVAEAPPRPEDDAAADGGDAAMADAAPAAAVEQGDTSAVCVNPGRLARGSLGGTFAHIHVGAGGGALGERVRVDIIRV